MLMKSLVAASALLLTTSAFAATSITAKTPGHRMQSATVSTAPGASEYAPGHLKKSLHLRSARTLAPGHLRSARVSTHSSTTVGSAPMTERSSTTVSKSRSSTAVGAGASVGGASVGAGVNAR